MTLSEEDGALFYKLWLPLLEYVNNRYRVSKRFGRMLGRNVLWSAVTDYFGSGSDTVSGCYYFGWIGRTL